VHVIPAFTGRLRQEDHEFKASLATEREERERKKEREAIAPLHLEQMR
jgi:hypothetical protein